jgi:hypothetical protein
MDVEAIDIRSLSIISLVDRYELPACSAVYVVLNTLGAEAKEN